MAWHSAPPTPPVPPPIVGTPLRPPVKVLRRCSGDCDQGLKNTAPAHAKAQDVHPDPPPLFCPSPTPCRLSLPYTWLAHNRLQSCLGAPRCLDQPRHMPGAAAVYCLAHHRQQLGHRASRCLDHMPRDMPCAPAVYIIGICCGRLAHTSSAPAGPWCWRLAV